MKRNLLVVLNSTAALALVLATSPAPAQQNDGQAGLQNQQQNRQDRNQQYLNQRNLSAAEFVRRAAIGNLFELRASRLATSESDDEAVKDFARKLVKNHWEASANLKDAAGDLSVETELDQRHARMIDRLKQTSGNDFDRQFIRMQIRAHRQAISLYSSWINQNESGSSQTTASGQSGRANQDLLEFAEETLPTLEEHLRMAQELRSELRQGSGIAAGQNRRNMAQNQRSGNATQNWQRNAQNQQGRAALEIQQRSPEVTVRRQAPEVSVRQPRPQITVRQAPPTITIQQPPPEIIVQMPRPDVNVQSPRPQVSVDVRRPQIRFQESDAEPRVRFQQQASDGRQVEFERGQPEVDYQRTGQPRVIYQQSDSKPRVRYQSQAQSGTEGQRSRKQSGSNAQASGDQDWAKEARRLTEDNAATESNTTGSGSNLAPRSMTAAQLTDTDIYNANGENLGSIDDVVVNGAGRTYVVLAHGGFLGMFEDEVALPLDRLRYRGNRLVVSGLTEQEISAMPDWETRVPDHQPVDDAQSFQINQ